MIKITASHSMKVPAEGEYTSKSFHLGLEAEVADTLGGEGILAKSRALFALAKAAVAAEINGKAKPAQQSPVQPANGQAVAQNGANGGNGVGNGNAAPSGKQLSYLLLLAKKNGGIEKLNAEIKREFGADDVAKLSRKQVSGLIESVHPPGL